MDSAGRKFTLPDGTVVLVRPIRPEDRDTIQEGLRALSERSRLHRFGTVPQQLSEGELRYLTEVDQVDHIALLAFDVGGPDPLGVATTRCVRVRGEADVAEPALTVIDSHQGRGIGTLLLALLTEEARAQGIRHFRSYVIAPNDRMIEILQQLGSERRGREGSLVWFETLLTDPADLPDTPAARVFRAIAAGEDPPKPR